jgi:hypothetical protein
MYLEHNALSVKSPSRLFFSSVAKKESFILVSLGSPMSAEALVLAAEARTGLRPRRRTDLLSQRIEAFEQQTETMPRRLLMQQECVQKARDRLAEARQQVPERRAILADLKLPGVPTGRTPNQPFGASTQALESR